MKEVDLILVGLGNVHRSFLHLLATRHEVLRTRHDLVVRVVGVADSRGAATDPSGLDPAALLAHKLTGHSVADFVGGVHGVSALHLAASLPADMLLEASPVNLHDAQPSLGVVLAALERGLDVVLANKAPLALYYKEVQHAAWQSGGRVAFSATVCGGLPVVNVGRRDLIAAQISRVEGVFNSTSNYILSEMAEGADFTAALAEAQRRGLAETDPSLDVDGWDTANKLTIVANAVLGVSATVRDVQPVTGIRAQPLTPVSGKVWRLVGSAERATDGSYALSVQPRLLAAQHPLARVHSWQMGVVFESDLFETVFISIDERGPQGTAAAMLRDVVNLVR